MSEDYACKVRQGGAVLLTTIIMMVMITLLVLTLLQAVFIYCKGNSQLAGKRHEFYQLEATALKLTRVLIAGECMQAGKTPNQIVALLAKNHGCSLQVGGRIYYYLLDDLGDFACLQIKLGYGSHHWLISVMNSQHEILQLRLVKPGKASDCEQGDRRIINGGILSWRYLA